MASPPRKVRIALFPVCRYDGRKERAVMHVRGMPMGMRSFEDVRAGGCVCEFKPSGAAGGRAERRAGRGLVLEAPRGPLRTQ